VLLLRLLLGYWKHDYVRVLHVWLLQLCYPWVLLLLLH
jgi:hypothetical protein